MDWLRENMKAFIWVTVVAFIATIFAGWGMGYMQWGKSPNLGTVNGTTISFNNYQKTLDQRRKRYRQKNPGPITNKDMKKIRQKAFKDVVDQILLRQTVQQYNAGATDRQVRRYLRRYFVDKSGKVNVQRMKKFFQSVSKRRLKRMKRREKKTINSRVMRQWLANNVTLTKIELT
ncbi:MAG: SurA N-terminal domain-containing protein, partial [bacterium]